MRPSTREHGAEQEAWGWSTARRPKAEHRRVGGSTTSVKKRQKEAQRQAAQREKAERKAERKAEKANRPPGVEGEDPDIAGIVPGPQPIPPEDEQ